MIFLYFFILLLSFYILGKVVDVYFVPALDKIAEKWKMSHDAAGATLMAVGSSAPELFVALFAVIHPKESHAAIGVGNIIGSALFNMLVIIGASALIAKASLNRQDVLRDLTFYVIAVLLLLLTLIDGDISYTDTLLMLSVYIIYVFVVVFWRRLLKRPATDEIPEELEDDQEVHNSLLSKLLQPIDFVLSKIIPRKKYYGSVFFVSILLIAGISWLLVESAVAIASILEIPESIIALTILAAGTSIPDLISSIVVSKQGRAGMAISNAVGSNIFDILVGLGLPFLIFIMMQGGHAEIDTAGLEKSAYFLLGAIVLILSLFVIKRWVIGRFVGWTLLLLYAAYLFWEILRVV